MAPNTQSMLLAGALALAAGCAFASAEDPAAEAFARLDRDRDGSLSIEEFRAGLARPRGANGNGVVYQRLPARFRGFDADDSSYLEAGEFARVVQRWQGPGPAPTLAAGDLGGDGRIDFREFVALHAPAGDEGAAEATPDERASR